MTQQDYTQHSITPPPELVEEWRTASEYATGRQKLIRVSMTTDRLQEIATQAAQYGADQELEACCEWLRSKDILEPAISALRAARRPKPPSLRKQAYDALDTYIYGEPDPKDKERTYNTIRRALETLDDN